MDTNLSHFPTPKMGTTIRVIIIGVDRAGPPWIGKVVHVFPKEEEIPEEMMRKYYQPKAGSMYDKNPRILCKPSKYDRVVTELEPGHYRVHPHQRYFDYEEV